VTLGVLVDDVLEKLGRPFKVAIAERRPSVCPVNYVNVLCGIDHPLVAAKFTDVIIALADRLAAAGLTNIQMHFDLLKDVIK
jgi:hypothetical protein